MKKTFYITTAIDYVNAEPHIGHAYQKIIADVLARWHKLLGKDVFFVTGTDEHGKKLQRSAEKAKKSPKEFVDEMSEKFKAAWKALNIEYDRFIRTTDEDHQKIVQDIIKKVNDKGEIYKGDYSGLYCVDCEAYYSESEVRSQQGVDEERGSSSNRETDTDFICPVHKKPLENLKEESYFFKLSNYQDFLLDLYDNTDLVLPKTRRNEVRNRVKEGLKDLSISRASFNWGIPFPLDKKHITYVWFDALLNYYTATQSSPKLKKFWPADVHLLGKDNTWFHTVYWPAMLKAADLPLPKTVFNHGFLTFNGEKISKSLGNVISPNVLVEKYGSDTVRYFSCRHFPFASGEDGDFSESALVDRHNNELANKLGNLVSRVSTLAEKYGIEKCKVDPLPKKIKSAILNDKAKFKGGIGESKLEKGKQIGGSHVGFWIDRGPEGIEEFTFKNLEQVKEYIGLIIPKKFDKFELDKVLNDIFLLIDYCNWYIQDKKPWETHDAKVLYEAADAIKTVAILISPFIPETAAKIAKTFNFKLTLEDLNKPQKVSKIKKSEILFKKI